MAAAQATSFTQFGPSPFLRDLPAAFQACIPPNPPTAACDTIVGGLAEGYGYCATPQYAQTTYCACVNNAIPCPASAAAACTNAAFAYLQTRQSPGGAQYEECKGVPICVNVLEVGGSQNLTSGLSQQCGTITNITRALRASPALAALAFILLIALIALAAAKSDQEERPGAAARAQLIGPP